MSDRYIPTKDSHRQKQLKWMNGLCYLHDNFCDCYNPLAHTVALICEKEPKIQFSTPEKQLIQKCLSGEEDTAIVHTATDGEGIQEGDLEKLFEEPFGEDDTG